MVKTRYIPDVRKILSVTLAGFSIAIFSNIAITNASEEINPVENLVYGNALYHFYLESPLQSLTQVELLRHSLANTDNGSPETKQVLSQAILLETALKLDYGMELSAKAELDSLFHENSNLHENNAVQNTDQLWFYLAQIFYDRQLYDFTRETLHNIHEPQALAHYDKWQYLNAQLLLKEGDYKKALEMINSIDKKSIYAIYSQFNLAIYYYRNNDAATATGLLDTLINQLEQPDNPEKSQLKDRLLISIAYIHFYAGDTDKALAYFRRVNTGSVFLDEALLGLGQAAIEKKQFSLAISLWEKFREHPLLTQRKIEASLALAKLYEEQNNNELALATLEDINSLCQQRITNLSDISRQYDSETVWRTFSSLLDSSTASQIRSTNQNSPANKTDASDITALLKNNPFLVDLMYSDNFSAQMDNLHDIEKMQAILQEWHKKIPLYQTILDTKTSAYAKKSIITGEQTSALPIDDIKQQYSALKEWLDKIEAEKDVTALFTADEETWAKKIALSEETMQQLTDDPFQEEYAESLRRIKGVMLWNSYSHYHSRLWNTRKQLNALEQQIMENDAYNTALRNVLDNNATFPVMQQSINSNASALDDTLRELDTMTATAKTSLKSSFDLSVNNEIQQTKNFQRQARIAIARVSETFLIENSP